MTRIGLNENWRRGVKVIFRHSRRAQTGLSVPPNHFFYSNGHNNIALVWKLHGLRWSKKANFGRFCHHDGLHNPQGENAAGVRAYVDLMDTADWIKGELRGPLMSFDLAIGEFRLLELLYREGAMFIADIARRRGVHRAGVEVTIARLARRGWVGQRLWRCLRWDLSERIWERP